MKDKRYFSSTFHFQGKQCCGWTIVLGTSSHRL